jgi:hypothetical protein
MTGAPELAGKPEGDEAEALSVGYHASTMAKSGIISALFLTAAAYAGYLAAGLDSVLAAFAFVALGLATVLTVPLYLRAVVRALRGAPLLTLDREGVTLHSARIHLPWSNIKEIRIDHTAGHGPAHDMIVFVPADEHAAVTPLRGLRRRFARDGIERLGGPIFVRAGHLSTPLEEILTAARKSTPAPIRHNHKLGKTPANISH